MAKKRSPFKTVSVEVDVEVEWVLEGLEDEDIVEECEKRGIRVGESGAGSSTSLYELHERIDRWALSLGPNHPLYYEMLSASTECRLSRPKDDKPGPLLKAMKQ